jgi:predicted nicotinamide N-methyase
VTGIIRVVESVVSLGDRQVALVHPRDAESLLDEQAFDQDEFLPYWAELWPRGGARVRAVSGRDLSGRKVLELGCGLALPSIAAALAGARALATDWSPEAVALAGWNARRNGAQLSTAVVDWADPGRLLEAAPWELVVAADVLYERRNAELLLDLLPALVDEHGEVLLADPGRPAARPFLERSSHAFRVASATDLAPRVALHSLRLKRSVEVPHAAASAASGLPRRRASASARAR